jgi:hypothetical protein
LSRLTHRASIASALERSLTEDTVASAARLRDGMRGWKAATGKPGRAMLLLTLPEPPEQDRDRARVDPDGQRSMT